MAIYNRYEAIGAREDLSDVIYNISPTDTPIMSSIGKTKATGVYHEWQTDSLAAVFLYVDTLVFQMSYQNIVFIFSQIYQL